MVQRSLTDVFVFPMRNVKLVVIRKGASSDIVLLSISLKIHFAHWSSGTNQTMKLMEYIQRCKVARLVPQLD